MDPTDITRMYKVPSDRFETDGDVINYQGYLLEEKVSHHPANTFLMGTRPFPQQLDAGGFGVIFFARDKRKNLKVACKLMDLGDDWNDERVVDMKNVS